MPAAAIAVRPDDRPVINPLFLFRWEDTQDAYVLLYPEGIVKLNATAGEILKRCTGDATVAQMVEELKQVFSAGDSAAEIERGVRTFLETSHAKGWTRNKP